MGLRAGIKAEGLEEGRDVIFDVRSTGSDEKRAALLAAALARENPDVIVAIGENETRAAKAAAPEIPIVFSPVVDPVALPALRRPRTRDDLPLALLVGEAVAGLKLHRQRPGCCVLHRTFVARLQEVRPGPTYHPRTQEQMLHAAPRAFSIAVSGKLSAGLPFRQSMRCPPA